MENRSDVKRLMGAATGFLEAARLIQEHEAIFLWPPFYVNLSYAIEISLKAYLTSRGHSRRELVRLGHDLQSLAAAAAKLGYQIDDPRLHELIQQLDGRLQELRYMLGDDGIEVVPAAEAIALVWTHIRTLCLVLPLSDLREDD